MKTNCIILLGFCFLYLFHSLSGNKTTKCHPENDNSICYCEESLVVGRFKIFCRDIIDTETFIQDLSAFAGMPIELLEVINSTLPYFDEHLFKGMEIHSLYFEDLKLHSLFSTNGNAKSPLKHLKESLLFFRASEVHIDQQFDWRWFEDLQNLTTLEFNTLKDNGYQNWESLRLASLKNFLLFDSDIETLPSKALSQLSNVEDVIINYGKLSKISRDVFPNPANKLKLLHLSENDLVSLPEDMFTNMPLLKSVTLDGNRLTTLSQATFAPVMKHLVGVAIAGNPFRCDRKLFWVMKANFTSINSDVKRVICDTPNNLHNRLLSSLNDNEFMPGQ